MKNRGAKWTVCKEKFIAEFDDVSAKKLHSIFDRKEKDQNLKDYVEKKIEIWSKFFPALSSSDLNLIALAGLDESSIKALKSHKSSEKETFIKLCEYYSTLEGTESEKAST